jgi:hypothetical protein
MAGEAGELPKQAAQFEQWREYKSAVQQVIFANLEPEHIFTIRS